MSCNIFNHPVDGNAETALRDGLFWTLTAHELGHNIGCYTQQFQLREYEDVFEELKANILPILWVLDIHRRGIISREAAEAAVVSYVCLDLMDCVLARTVPSRNCYCTATMIQINYLLKFGGLRASRNGLTLELDFLARPNRQLLDQVLQILSLGNKTAAHDLLNVTGIFHP